MATNERIGGVKYERIRALDAQLAAAAGELLVACGAAEAPPAHPQTTVTTWLHQPGAGVFALRRMALERSRGAVVALTEDHCVHPTGWVEAVLAAHRRHAEADVVVARVDNGSAATLVDRASFWVNFGSLRPPLEPRAATRQISAAGTSIKREALERLLAACSYGPEVAPPDVLARLGIRLTAVETFGVSHVQADSWRVHAGRHFHNARALSGDVGRTHRRTWARLAATPVLLVVRVGRTLAQARRDGASASECVRLVAPVGWIYGAKALGEWLGVLSGPGDSATRLE